MGMENETIEDFISQAKKICLGFQSQDRKVRKRTYTELEKFLSSSNAQINDQTLRNMFSETHMYFLNGLRDKAEAVREQAIKFTTYLVSDCLPLNDFYLTYIFPIIVERIGTVELVEDSEEIRLQMLRFTDTVVTKYSNTEQLKPFLNDCIIILCEAVKDKYPAIKELSCELIIKLAKALPKDFHMQAETLLKPVLVSCFGHQRYKVRIKAIRAVGEIIMHSSYKGLDEVVVPMAEKLFDQIPAVRQAVAQEAANWLLNQRDRYSFFYKILPLLITGLNDEVDETRREAHALWHKVGLQYQQENEQDLKDKLDYLAEPPKNYPKHLKRPNLGCRVLVQRNVSKLASGISNELTNWQEDVRVRCSQLLCSLALHAEEDLTFHLQSFLPAMYSAARDHDQRVVSNIVQASEIIGLFVSFDTWAKLVLPVVEDGPHYGHLTVLAGLVNGAPKENISSAVQQIGALLSEDYICCNRKGKYQLEMLACVRALMEKCEHKEESSGFSLFKIITTLIALKDPENAEILSSSLYKELADALNLSSENEVFIKYANGLFVHINVNPKLWTTVNNQACIFLTLLSEVQEAFALNLDIISDVLVELLDNEVEVEMRLKTFYVLATVFEEKDVAFKRAENLTGFLEKMILEVFVPSLVWHAGASAEAIRTMSGTCLKFALLPIKGVELFNSDEVLGNLMQKLVPLLLSLMEDASFRSRQVAIECVVLLKAHCDKRRIWSNDDLLKVYPEILKRLDDPIEKVRLCALRHLSELFRDIPSEFTQANFKAHRELITDTLMTHFDDDDEVVQKLVFDVLQVVSRIDKTEMLKKIEVHRPLLRNQQGCDKLVSCIEEE